MSRSLRSIILIAILAAFPAPSALALLGVGDVVFDPTALQQQLVNYAMQITQYGTQMQQYSNQMQQLQVQYDNMRSLGYRADLSNLSEMQQVMNSAVGVSNDFARMQQQFQTLYPDFSTYKGQQGIDYARQSSQWSQTTQQNARDMLTVTTNLQQSIAQDQASLRYLNGRSDSASGTKDLLQTMNQLLVLQTKQLFQLQQLIATSAKADAAYLAEKSSTDEAFRAQGENIYRGWTDKGARSLAPKPGHVLQ